MTEVRAVGVVRYLPAILALAATVWLLGFLGPVARGATPEFVRPWVPVLGIDFAVRLDGLSLAMALLIAGIGAICLLYTAAYFRTDARLGSLLVTLSAFALAMLGLVTADDAVTLFVFWEATTITSWLLVGFDHEKASARAAALQALVVTGLGGLALLAGLLVMGGLAGTWRLSEMNAIGAMFRADAAYPAIFALVMLGCFTKSAQWPFQFWLPGAMAAPIPVSAYLHSATMVKAGVYLMARLTPALGGTELWFWTLTLVGGFTMLLASVWSLRQADLKLMFAHTTVMALGTLTMLLGLGTPLAVTAAMTFLLVHAFYKAALFLGAGMIETGAGTRDYTQLRGLARAMPLTAGVVTLAALSMAGVPPFFGFIGKELVYKSAEHAPMLITVAALAANAMMVACAAAASLRPFFGGAQQSPRDLPGDPGWGLWLGAAVLAALGLGLGVVPQWIDQALIAPMVRAVTGTEPPVTLELWHGVNRALILSLVTFGIGGMAYLGLDRIRGALAAAEPGLPRTQAWYEGAVAGCLALARVLTGLVQAGRMTSYLRHTFLALALLVWGAVLLGTATWPRLGLDLRMVEWAILLIMVAATCVVLSTRSRLTAITALSGIGAGIAMIFVLYGAIDVAMTQLFVEILVVVFLAIAMVRLPPAGTLPFRGGNAIVALLLGTGTTLGFLSVLGTDLDLHLTAYYEAMSAPVALGRNVVNVIIVDFRGLDTLGEIAVVVLAGVASIAALQAGRKAPQ